MPINRKFKLFKDSAVYQAADASTSVVGQVHHGPLGACHRHSGNLAPDNAAQRHRRFIPVAA